MADRSHHYDGAALQAHRAPRHIGDIRRVGSALLALESGPPRRVWERSGGRWIERPDLDAETVFPVVPRDPVGLVRTIGATRLAVNDSQILRDDP